MTTEQAIQILEAMNKWRRSEPPFDEIGTMMPHSPKEFGEAIDTAIAVMEAHRDVLCRSFDWFTNKLNSADAVDYERWRKEFMTEMKDVTMMETHQESK